MAFNKAFAVLLLLIVAAIANARVEFLKVSDISQPTGALKWTECCDNCECDEPESCTCLDMKDGEECPESCEWCYYAIVGPPRYICGHTIKTCPAKCTSSTTVSTTEPKLFKSLLAMKAQN